MNQPNDEWEEVTSPVSIRKMDLENYEYETDFSVGKAATIQAWKGPYIKRTRQRRRKKVTP